MVKKILLAFLFLMSVSFGETHNSSDVVNTNLFLKIIALENDFYTTTAPYKITVLYSSGNRGSAEFLINMLRNSESYKKIKIKRPLNIEGVEVSNNVNLDVDAIYFLNTSHKENKSIVSKVMSSHIITFSPDTEDLSDGVLISVEITTKVVPVINMFALDKTKIEFNPILLQVSKKF